MELIAIEAGTPRLPFATMILLPMVGKYWQKCSQ